MIMTNIRCGIAATTILSLTLVSAAAQAQVVSGDLLAAIRSCGMDTYSGISLLWAAPHVTISQFSGMRPNQLINRTRLRRAGYQSR